MSWFRGGSSTTPAADAIRTRLERYDDLTQAYAAPAVGDLDGDGLPDVLVGSVDGLVALYLTTVSEAHYGETWEDITPIKELASQGNSSPPMGPTPRQTPSQCTRPRRHL